MGREGRSTQPALREAGAGVFQGEKSPQAAVKARGPGPRLAVGPRHGRPQVGEEAAVLHEPRQLPLVPLPRRLRAPGVVRCEKGRSSLVFPLILGGLRQRKRKRGQAHTPCFRPRCRGPCPSMPEQQVEPGNSEVPNATRVAVLGKVEAFVSKETTKLRSAASASRSPGPWCCGQ